MPCCICAHRSSASRCKSTGAAGAAALAALLLTASSLPHEPAAAVDLCPLELVVSRACVPAASAEASRDYLLFTGFPFPLGPFTERRTVQSELVPGKVYGFEQEIRLSGISANVRSTVFRMKDNHLLVYNPVAPTEELLRPARSCQLAAGKT